MESTESTKLFVIFSYKEVSENHVKITFYVRIVQNNPISIEKHSYFAVFKFGEYGESTFFAIFNQIRGIILIRYHFCTLNCINPIHCQRFPKLFSARGDGDQHPLE